MRKQVFRRGSARSDFLYKLCAVRALFNGNRVVGSETYRLRRFLSSVLIVNAGRLYPHRLRKSVIGNQDRYQNDGTDFTGRGNARL